MRFFLPMFSSNAMAPKCCQRAAAGLARVIRQLELGLRALHPLQQAPRMGCSLSGESRIKRGRGKSIQLDVLTCPSTKTSRDVRKAGAIHLTFGASVWVSA